MNPIRRSFIRKQILEILDTDRRFMWLEQPTLLAHLNLVLTPPATVLEFEDVLQRMESDRLIVRLPTDEGIKDQITEAGQAARMK